MSLLFARRAVHRGGRVLAWTGLGQLKIFEHRGRGELGWLVRSQLEICCQAVVGRWRRSVSVSRWALLYRTRSYR